MAGVTAMHELRRGAGRGQGRRDLARDMCALADAGQNDPARGSLDQLDQRHEGAVEPGGQRFQPFGLQPDRGARLIESELLQTRIVGNGIAQMRTRPTPC